MSEPFLNMLPVVRRSFLVIVQDASRAQDWQCGICKEWIEDEQCCAVCGRWACGSCLHPYNPPDSTAQVDMPRMCTECALLPREVQDAAYTLRLMLNR